MSRTDVHTPNWVKERDPFWRHHYAEDHDHSRGPCDLAEYLANPDRPWRATHCHIRGINRRRNISCGCHLCTGHYERKFEHRRDRARWRATRQALLSGADRP